jgi:hypothetical protein
MDNKFYGYFRRRFEMCEKSQLENRNGASHLENVVVDRRIILKIISK